MRGTDRDRCSSLPHFRTGQIFRPGCQTQSPIRATPRHSLISRHPTMTKPTANFDTKIFIPARSPVCRWAETLLIFSPAFAGVSAALIALITHFGAQQ